MKTGITHCTACSVELSSATGIATDYRQALCGKTADSVHVAMWLDSRAGTRPLFPTPESVPFSFIWGALGYQTHDTSAVDAFLYEDER